MNLLLLTYLLHTYLKRRATTIGTKTNGVQVLDHKTYDLLSSFTDALLSMKECSSFRAICL